MKKILLLGGSAQQIVAIEKAKELGYYTILCDYLPDNPGQNHCHRFYLASTTDKEAILNIAKQEKIDGILAYASDPAAPTAAYVAEKLGLPGNKFESVDILCNKMKFRKFLKENGFCCPNSEGYDDIEKAKADILSGKFKFPILVKPVDSSGSKGVSKISNKNDLGNKLQNALSFSRSKNIIIEEFVNKFGNQIAGDGMSIDGKLVFRSFADQYFDEKNPNPFVPYATTFPYSMPEYIQTKIHKEIQRLLTLLGMKNCTYNFDLRIDKDFNVYLMEVAPRDGGNYIPQIIKHLTNVDLVEASVCFAMGRNYHLPKLKNTNDYYGYYILHSYESGTLDSITIDEEFKKEHIIEEHYTKKEGDIVDKFLGANMNLGLLILRFKSLNEMLGAIENIDKLVKIRLK